MSQYGSASKNPPWARSTDVSNVSVQQQIQSQMINQLGQQVMYQPQSQVFQPPIGLQQVPSNNLMSPLNQSNVGLPGLNTQLYGQSNTVSYPVPRALNASAFGSGPVSQQLPPNQQAAPSQPTKQRVFTGTVTKLHDNFGFVDEDVFFPMSCCVKGSNPNIGDRVLVEASFNPNMPFKWNATRLQVLPMQGQGQGPGSGPGPAARKGFSDPPSSYNPASNQVPSRGERTNDIGLGNFVRSRSPRRDRPRRDADARDGDDDRKRRRESNDRAKDRDRERERDRDRDRERDRERERDKEKGSTRSPSVRKRSKSPRKRRVRPAPRYMVHVPKIALDVPDADVLELRRRYSNMYVPSDFFLSNFRWVDAFPPNTPFTMDRPCSFHVMHRDSDPVVENTAPLDPPDADYLFSAKVMLMSMPQMGEFLKKCCQMSEDIDPEADSEGRDFVHPTRLVNFLVGLRGKNETMAIGGPWSPSLDGPNPEKDPQVLIRTAIRNCKALTGIDLSTCTQWYRFLEIYYRRSETTHKGKLVAARVETVVLFLPDVWSCVPTRLEWDGLHLNYKRQLDRKLKALLQIDYDEDAAAVDEKEGDESSSVIKREPTPWNRLDAKSLKVTELREELEARNINSKGLKNQLLARLQKALKFEQELDESGVEEEEVAEEIIEEIPKEVEKVADKEEDENKKKEDEEKKRQLEKEKVILEKRYELPENPHVVVHPNRVAKSGKFDCTTMSLSLLLDYRQDDTKEHSFEVSLFAELFNEMLMRDYGFRIYRTLHEVAEKVKEEEREKEKKKKEEKDKKEKDDKEKNPKETDDKESDKETDAEKMEEDSCDQDASQDGDKRSKDGKDDRDDKDKKEKDHDSKEKDKKKKEKMFTVNPQLLLAFVYFDQSHCGYILDKDVEELMYALGLNLSRAQVRRLVQSVLSKDSKDSRENREALFYRRLTDKPKPEENGTGENTSENSTNDSHTDSREMTLVGNRSLLPVFSFTHDISGSPPAKRARVDRREETSNVPEGFVMFKGGLLDVGKLTEQLKRSEKARSDTENLLISLREELNSTKKSAQSATSNVKELTTKVEQLNDSLFSTTEELSKAQVKSDLYIITLKGIHESIDKVLSSVTLKNEICEPVKEEGKSE